MNAYKAQGQPLCIISKFYKKPRRFVNDPHYTEDEMEAERPCPGSQSLTSPSCTFLVCKVGIILRTFRGGWRKGPSVLGTLPLASRYSLHPPHQPQPPTWGPGISWGTSFLRREGWWLGWGVWTYGFRSSQAAGKEAGRSSERP